MHKVVPILLVFGDVQSKLGDERAVEVFDLSLGSGWKAVLMRFFTLKSIQGDDIKSLTN